MGASDLGGLWTRMFVAVDGRVALRTVDRDGNALVVEPSRRDCGSSAPLTLGCERVLIVPRDAASRPSPPGSPAQPYQPPHRPL